MNDGMRIGLLFSSTGATAIPESGLLAASLLGIERCNSDFGTRFEPIVSDIQSDPAAAARAAYALVREHKADILIGCYTSACRKAVIPVLEETGSSLVYPTIYEGEEAHPRIFYFGAVPNQQVEPLLSWTISHLSKDFVLVGSDYIYPRSVSRQVRTFVESSGGRILHEVYFPLGCEDFRPFLESMRILRGRSPPVVFSTLVGRSIPAFYAQHLGAGLRSTIVSPITSELEVSSMGMAAAAGHYFADGHLEDPATAARDGFAAEYRHKFGDKPINGMMGAVYDAIQLLGRSSRKAGAANGTDRQRRVGGMLRTPFHETLHGKIALDVENQHSWLWTRVARVGRAGGVETLWTSPGPMPPRPLGERPSSAAVAREHGVALQAADAFGALVGRSESFSQCVRMARVAARTTAPVLLMGETGTGKELFAHAIHEASSRAKGAFVAINCGAIPRDLIASELFGYAPGAFTGAQREGRKGKFELADGGTLFLDEITEMPFELQAALLRALQEKKIAPIGSSRDIDIDIRVIAATNRTIAPELDSSSSFRPDLYFRLNVFRIDLPPLRNRREDIPQLIHAVLARLNTTTGRHLTIARDAMAALIQYGWPGNVRELENALERAFHVAIDGPRIELVHLPPVVAAAGSPVFIPAAGTPAPGGASVIVRPAPSSEPASTGWDDAGADQEKQVISRAILSSGYNMSRASRVLGVSRSTLYRRLKALHIVIPDLYAPKRAHKISI